MLGGKWDTKRRALDYNHAPIRRHLMYLRYALYMRECIWIFTNVPIKPLVVFREY